MGRVLSLYAFGRADLEAINVEGPGLQGDRHTVGSFSSFCLLPFLVDF